jgi:acyl carrier protein
MLDPRLAQAVARVLRLDVARVTPETSPDTTSSWDSVAHLSLIFELEDVFDVRFPSEEIPLLNSAARLQEAISRLNGSG